MCLYEPDVCFAVPKRSDASSKQLLGAKEEEKFYSCLLIDFTSPLRLPVPEAKQKSHHSQMHRTKRPSIVKVSFHHSRMGFAGARVRVGIKLSIIFLSMEHRTTRCCRWKFHLKRLVMLRFLVGSWNLRTLFESISFGISTKLLVLHKQKHWGTTQEWGLWRCCEGRKEGRMAWYWYSVSFH